MNGVRTCSVTQKTQATLPTTKVGVLSAVGHYMQIGIMHAANTAMGNTQEIVAMALAFG